MIHNEWWPQACAALTEIDERMAWLIAEYPTSRLTSRGEPFETLLRAIVGQQISTKAADAIWARVSAIAEPTQPQQWLKVTDDVLRTAGLSARKVEYVRSLAEHFTSGGLSLTRLQAADDDEVIRLLCEVRGIGRWSAEMFLIFYLMRPDVWPVDNLALQKAVRMHYFSGGEPLSLADYRAIGERWRPWRSAACWYLWRSLDGTDIHY